MTLLDKRHYLTASISALLTLFSTATWAEDWAWQLESATMFESVVAIQHTDGKIDRYDFQCNLTDALNEKTEESPTIEKAVSTAHPDGVLIVTCYKGAHAEVLEIIDPSIHRSVYKKIGSYFVDWHLEKGNIVIEYDMPCYDTQAKACADPDNRFTTITETWP